MVLMAVRDLTHYKEKIVTQSISRSQPHPPWCDPRECQDTDPDPINTLHGSSPITIITKDATLEVSARTYDDGDAYVAVTSHSTALVIACGCGRHAELTVEHLYSMTELDEVLIAILRARQLADRPVGLGGAA